MTEYSDTVFKLFNRNTRTLIVLDSSIYIYLRIQPSSNWSMHENYFVHSNTIKIFENDIKISKQLVKNEIRRNRRLVHSNKRPRAPNPNKNEQVGRQIFFQVIPSVLSNSGLHLISNFKIVYCDMRLLSRHEPACPVNLKEVLARHDV